MVKERNGKAKQAADGPDNPKPKTAAAQPGAAKNISGGIATMTKPERSVLKRRPPNTNHARTTVKATRAVSKARRTIEESLQAPQACLCTPEPTFESIRCRAHEIYLRRGGAPGDALSDWLQAERELRVLLAAQSVSR